MRLRRICALLFVTAAVVCASAQAPRTATRVILASEESWLHARTAEEAGRFLAPDFVGINTRGMIENRAQRLARFRPAPQPPAASVHFENLTVAFPAPTVAIATGNVVGLRSHGERVYIVAFSDTFCWRHGRWLAVHAQETLKQK